MVVSQWSNPKQQPTQICGSIIKRPTQSLSHIPRNRTPYWTLQTLSFICLNLYLWTPGLLGCITVTPPKSHKYTKTNYGPAARAKTLVLIT